MNDDTLALVKSALAGDRDSFARLAETHGRVAASVAYSILSDAHLAADAVQDAFLKAFQRLGQLQEPEAFQGWFLNIVRASALDLLRKRRRGRRHALLYEAQAAGNGRGAGPGNSGRSTAPPELLQREEDAEIIRRALASLSPEYREVILLKHLEGRSYREMARLLKTSVRAVESKLFRARQQLSDALRAHGIGPGRERGAARGAETDNGAGTLWPVTPAESSGQNSNDGMLES